MTPLINAAVKLHYYSAFDYLAAETIRRAKVSYEKRAKDARHNQYRCNVVVAHFEVCKAMTEFFS
jgi:hypothetical protein